MFCAFYITFSIGSPLLVVTTKAVKPLSTQVEPPVVIDCDKRKAYIDIVDPLIYNAVSMSQEATITRNYNSGHLVINEYFSQLTRVPFDTISAATDLNSIATNLLTAAHALLKTGDDESYASFNQRDYTYVDLRLAEINSLVYQYEQAKQNQCGTTEQE